ncbi:hypothetical protein MO973_06295 [Paenibacillus sp. TRM 82003]|uniref:hypothetical protein n=1 Tax=Kineococcus sp. TRM81007 TaxID=2925831 RepID=UPI001F584B14|nr:hypothetical protein [Kineococcus sp. TRM81007]MCI2237488.1 hypothetical protein [Kineococcus sp. TRM81007]MCI3919841.1 hypothetical protein [Paenibacillus sp. TRM 82003]
MSEQERRAPDDGHGEPQPPVPQPTGAQQEDPAQQEEPAQQEGARLVQVTRRRAPRFRAFVLTGVVVAFLAAAVVAVLTPPAAGYSQQDLLGYLFVSFGLVGALLGGLVAVLADRTRARGGAGRRR